jgi:hypothetical protein
MKLVATGSARTGLDAKQAISLTILNFVNLPGSARKQSYLPMQKVEKIKFRMSSGVVVPVRESRASRVP